MLHFHVLMEISMSTHEHSELPSKQQWLDVPCKYKQFRCYLTGNFSVVNEVNRPKWFSSYEQRPLPSSWPEGNLNLWSKINSVCINSYDPAMFHFIICSQCPPLAATIERDNPIHIAQLKSVSCPVAAEVSRGSQTARGIYVFTEEFKREKHSSAHL